MGIPATAEDTTSRARIDMIGVPFDGMGRSPGQAGAAEALRAAGLPAAFGPDAVMEPDLMLPGPVAQRAVGSGLLNERALLQMIDALYRRVCSSLSAGGYMSISMSWREANSLRVALPARSCWTAG
jgi:arginase family enzyme